MKIIINKQIITKTDVITVLNSILNEKNKNIISKWIEIILSMDDKIFQQKLEKNNIETIEQIKSFFKPRISKIMSTSDKSKQEDRYLSTASWRKSNPTYETKQFLLALLIKEKINSNKLTIIDAGAGLGRNSIYLAKNGFKVVAVEYDEGAINPLKNNIRNNNQSDNIQVVNSNILDFLRQQKNNSIDALLDSGMSHYLTIHEKQEYFSLLRQKMTKDGLFSITHFSKEDESAIGLSESELRALLGKMLELDEIHFDTWVDSISRNKHFAYKGLLIMSEGKCEEIRESFQKIYALILKKEITSIEQICKYLDEQFKSKNGLKDCMQDSNVRISTEQEATRILKENMCEKDLDEAQQK